MFVLSARAGCSGNLNTLLEHSNPPTILSVSDCYDNMFADCTNLTTAPALPATTLAEYCYANMFNQCTNLVTPPALPATTLANNCYQGMFVACTKLKVSSSKIDSYQYAWRIPTSGTISSTPSGWNSAMLVATGGTFKSDPSINTTYYVENEPA